VNGDERQQRWSPRRTSNYNNNIISIQWYIILLYVIEIYTSVQNRWRGSDPTTTRCVINCIILKIIRGRVTRFVCFHHIYLSEDRIIDTSVTGIQALLLLYCVIITRVLSECDTVQRWVLWCKETGGNAYRNLFLNIEK